MTNTRPVVPHPWVDPDGDGHNCILCDPESIYKCDQAAHSTDPYDWLEPEQREELLNLFREMAKARVTALAAAGSIPLASVDDAGAES
jgi:hypothetical protein